MVKSHFPGRISKNFKRRRVSGFSETNSNENEDDIEAQDVYRRLELFNLLFSTDDEDNSFHGFSPHELERKIVDIPKRIGSKRKLGKQHVLPFSPKKIIISVPLNDESFPENIKIKSLGEVNIKSELKVSSNSSLIKDGSETNVDPQIFDRFENKDNIPLNSTLSGKFILPSRSAHSSRVIKPNKRFLQHDSPVVLSKSSRLKIDDNASDFCTNSLKLPVTTISDGNSSKTNAKSPAKFVLRKPRLKIKSQPLPAVGGPFSSPGANSLNSHKLRHKRPSATKVCCGVCGSFRTYRFFKQARKFGIFACDQCIKFIKRIIKYDREKQLKTLTCNSGTGNCPIRQLLTTQPFSSESSNPPSIDESARCEACWLNLCVRSFHMPERLSKRLTSYLPSQVTQKSLISFEKPNKTTDWGTDKKNKGIDTLNTNLSDCESNDKQKLPKRNNVLKENINVRRGANLRLSSHRGRGYNNRQKLPLTGPRVKHVCRSASLVLGQPTATFLLCGQHPETNGSQTGSDITDISDISDSKSVEIDEYDSVSIDKNKRSSEEESVTKNQTNLDYPPVARMLQDLGKANCEILDGIENHELQKLTARVSIDFWEAYDPEEVTQMGFPLIGYNPLKLKALCFLCGSAGLEKMLHCSSCCEPYHTFCVSNFAGNLSNDWWRIDWLCPKCTTCEACFKTGGTQLSCSHCYKSYHSGCISTVRANIADSTWVCPSCLFCKSCKDTNVHVFVGNMPLCKMCFKLRKKGNFCPLCQCCYDDNDYNTKMMECAMCKCWIHAKCEGISNEKYQVLSYLPSSIEFVCKLCCKTPPAPWSVAVDSELRAGYLNVIKILSKNKNACAVLKTSPKKEKCSCIRSMKMTSPITLPELIGNSDTLKIHSDSRVTSPEREIKTVDLGLLTPKLTKDDEESLIDLKVKKDFPYLVTEDKLRVSDCSSGKESSKKIINNNQTSLLSIAYDNIIEAGIVTTPKKFTVQDNILLLKEEKVCKCKISEQLAPQHLSLLTIKNKASSDGYRTVKEFHKDMEFLIHEISKQDLVDTYSRCLKQIFPWFDSNGLNDSLIADIEPKKKSNSIGNNKQNEKTISNQEKYPALKGLLNFESDYYYINSNMEDVRCCLFCKVIGEGQPMKEGRLLYCGQNEWVHTNCAMWSSEVFEEIDGSLQNVHSAISRARLIRCYECGKKGASLGCCAKTCPTAYHFICARSAECIFLENKEVYCKTHASHRGNKDLHKEEEFHINRSVYVELDRKRKKDVPRNEVRLFIGSLEVNKIGEIIPDLSDDLEVIIPCEFQCSRLYWSSKEPWKVVKYTIKTKMINFIQEYTHENDVNYTIDHSLEFTPPPSPIERIATSFGYVDPKHSENDIKTLVNYLVDSVCSKEEDANLSDQQNNDLLPPEVKEAIFEDLPQDFLDRISVNDIFTKISFDDILLSDSTDNVNLESNKVKEVGKLKNKKKPVDNKMKRPQNKLFKMVVKQTKLENIKERESFLERENMNKWKGLLQVDGAIDSSESDQSLDSCDVELKEENCEDKPVKCCRCHRTYRTSVSYDRHLSTCNVDYPSCSESDLSEEEKTQSLPDENIRKSELPSTNNNSQVLTYNIPIEVNTEPEIQTAIIHNSFENTVIHVDNTQYNGFSENSESIVNLNYGTINGNNIHNASFTTNEQTLVSSSIDPINNSGIGLQQTPTIIVQQVGGGDNIMPTYLSHSYQEPPQQSASIQYVTAINTQEKTQFLSANSIGQNTYHIQSPITQPVVQNVPAVVGTIIQNGVEQYLINNPTQNMDLYSHQNNMFVANQPMIVGMETVVSNTVMSSSRFISNSAPGPVLASSFSATTTQVFQAAKPVVDIPQGYLVVNTNSPMVTENRNTCIQNVIQNGTLTASNPSWNGYKINYQDNIKLNKNVTYRAIPQQIVGQKHELNGMKMITANEQISMKPLVLKHVAMKPKPKTVVVPTAQFHENRRLPVPHQYVNTWSNNLKPTNAVKIVELPSSSAVYKEKPQQAVAPVVIKKISPALIKSNVAITNEPEVPKKMSIPPVIPRPVPTADQAERVEQPQNLISTPVTNFSKLSEINCPTTSKNQEKKNVFLPKLNGLNDNNKNRKIVHEEPKISFEITSDDGFSYSTTNLGEAWSKVFETVQQARKSRNLPPLAQNPFASPNSMLKKLMGLGNNSMKYLLEQLPGITSCNKYKSVYHKKTLSALERELSRGGGLNPSGCARTEMYQYCPKTYDMFSWLASRHRRPPKMLPSDSDGINGNSRRATSMNLPMAMRFRHLKETSRISVGVFRSDIHGRGLFCLRDIDAGEMVIEYAGEVIRSALTDKRERYYTEKGIGCYMFRIDDKSVVDATMKGNAARFINHSCEPNCYSKVLDILGKKHILIFALRRILQGEELTYDYKFPLEEEKINCHCLSRKCRKYLN